MLRPGKPLSLIFADDGIISNNPRSPVIIYRGAVKVSGSRMDPAVVIDPWRSVSALSSVL